MDNLDTQFLWNFIEGKDIRRGLAKLPLSFRVKIEGRHFASLLDYPTVKDEREAFSNRATSDPRLRR